VDNSALITVGGLALLAWFLVNQTEKKKGGDEAARLNVALEAQAEAAERTYWEQGGAVVGKIFDWWRAED